MKKIVLFCLFILAILTINFIPQTFADDVWTMAESEQYGPKTGGMLGRGVVNVATCFVDLIVQTVDGTKSGPPFLGTMAGLGGGLGCSALRVSSGALDVATFWVPGFNGFPVSKSYQNCLDYDYSEQETIEETVTTTTYVTQPVVTPATPAAQQTQDPYQYVKK